VYLSERWALDYVCHRIRRQIPRVDFVCLIRSSYLYGDACPRLQPTAGHWERALKLQYQLCIVYSVCNFRISIVAYFYHFFMPFSSYYLTHNLHTYIQTLYTTHS